MLVSGLYARHTIPKTLHLWDACDELGMFIIVATPGWQYWNPEPVFEERILSDIRNMVRRDRNHPSVLLWEPVLNETAFPESFAQNAYRLLMKSIRLRVAMLPLMTRAKEQWDMM